MPMPSENRPCRPDTGPTTTRARDKVSGAFPESRPKPRVITAAALAALAALATLTTLPRQATAGETPLPRAVTLSTAGLAMIEAEVTLGAGAVTLSIPRRDIDDFLKSLWVIDPAQAPIRLLFDGPGAFDDSFARLPLTPEDVTDRARLLAALPGAPITVERQAKSWQGRNMGVTERPCPASENRCQMLSLLDDDDNLHQFVLDEALRLRLTDNVDRDAVDAALSAWRAASDNGRVAMQLVSAGEDRRQGALTWLQEAPLWRTAWRALDSDEGIRLLGWAVVENATGLDWQDVQLTLATGSVRAIRAPLYERVAVEREDADISALEPAIGAAISLRREAAPMRAMAPAAAPAETFADDGDSFTRFTLTEPVTLAAGQMITLPFLDQALPDARLTLHRGGRGERHPEIALRIENPLPLRLPAGVLTLYEDGRGHAGDAMIPELAPGASETIRFARDTAMEIREEIDSIELLREMRLVGGMLHVTEDLERRTRYRIEGAPQADRLLTIEHPRRSEWQVFTPDGAEEALDVWRWQVPVAAGAQVTHEVRERQPRLRRIALMDIDRQALATWETRATDPGLRDTLAELGTLRAEIAQAERAMRRLAESMAEREREQDRLVGLIVQLGDESAGTPERRDRVDAIDSEIAEIGAQRRAHQARIDDARARIEALLGEG